MKRYVAVTLVGIGVAGIGAVALRRPGVPEVCAHALALHNDRDRSLRGADIPPPEERCRTTLEEQERREWPWTFAAQMRCYLAADSPTSFHACGGELCHFGE